MVEHYPLVEPVEPVEPRTVQLGDVTARAASVDPKKKFVNVFTYIDLSSVDQSQKKISDTKNLEPSEAPSRARQIVQTSDVLISTVRPNLNGVAVVPDVLDGAIASTGFTVLRPIASKIIPAYLFQWVKSSPFVEDMISKATGASYPAVSDKIVRESFIPLPPLPEQRLIAAVLDKADHLRSQRREALAHLDALTQSIFDDMFGSPSKLADRWNEIPLADVALQITDGEHQTPIRTTAGIKLLSARNVQNGALDFRSVDFIGTDEYARISKRCKPTRGDILISCSGTIGRVSVIDTDEAFSLVRSVALVRPNPDLILSKFLEGQLLAPSLQAQMQRGSKSSGQANLFQAPIRKLRIILPPLELQQAFARRVTGVERLKEQHRIQLTGLDTLFASLQHRAFRGEL